MSFKSTRIDWIVDSMEVCDLLLYLNVAAMFIGNQYNF